MDEIQFYSSNNLEKYPDGKFNVCKKCQTMHVDNWNPDTFLPILQEADVPYVEHKWNEIVQKYCVNPAKVTGMTVIGRYFSQMKLNQWKDKRWKHSNEINEKYRQEAEEIAQEGNYTEEEKEKYLAGGLGAAPEWNKTEAEKLAEKNGMLDNTQPSSDPSAVYDEVDLLVSNDLTEEDKKYLLIKWGKYRPSEWVQLEQLYSDMNESFDIQTAAHKDTLKLVCKASLKSNQLLDIGDVDGAKKSVAMYDSLMKSGKFTAAQNKAETGEAIDSVAEMALICEKEGGFIPAFYQGQPNDCIDETLEDFKRYVRNLIENEQGLGDLIESALKKMQEDAEKEDLEDIDEDSIEALEEQVQSDLMTQADYEEFEEFLEEGEIN
jgi:hypothetical protein